jgi:hypothetical protein
MDPTPTFGAGDVSATLVSKARAQQPKSPPGQTPAEMRWHVAKPGRSTDAARPGEGGRESRSASRGVHMRHLLKPLASTDDRGTPTA